MAASRYCTLASCNLHVIYQPQPLFPAFFFTLSTASSTASLASSFAFSAASSTASEAVSSTFFCTASPTLLLFPPQPLPAAAAAFSALPALGAAPHPLPELWAAPGRVTPPALTRPATPRLARNFFRSLLFIMSSCCKRKCYWQIQCGNSAL